MALRWRRIFQMSALSTVDGRCALRWCGVFATGYHHGNQPRKHRLRRQNCRPVVRVEIPPLRPQARSAWMLLRNPCAVNQEWAPRSGLTNMHTSAWSVASRNSAKTMCSTKAATDNIRVKKKLVKTVKPLVVSQTPVTFRDASMDSDRRGWHLRKAATKGHVYVEYQIEKELVPSK